MKNINSYSKKLIKGIIFDFDGTLVDSEKILYISDKQVLRKYGINLTYQMKKKYIGGNAYDMMKDIKERYNLNESINTLVEEKDSNYLKIAEEHIELFPKMKILLNLLKTKKFKLAIASGSSHEILSKLLKKLDIISDFDVIVSSEDVMKGKPDPDIFIKTANKMNLPSRNIVVFEDSEYGIEAAKKADMYCIAIPYVIKRPLSASYLKADLFYKLGMKDFIPEESLLWIESNVSYK